MAENLWNYEREQWNSGLTALCGVDEAGAGPLAGPVYAAAVILPREIDLPGLNDSKKLSEKKREALFDQIVEKALAYKIVFVGPDIIDCDNILNATMGGMRQAVEGLDIVPNLVLVDGNRIPAGLTMPAQPVPYNSSDFHRSGHDPIPQRFPHPAPSGFCDMHEHENIRHISDRYNDSV